MIPDPARPEKVISVMSPGTQAGRSSLVANAALLMALSGQRVLVIDFDTDDPSIRGSMRRLRRQFIERDDEVAAVLGKDVNEALTELVSRRAATQPSVMALAVRRYGLPDSENLIDVVEIKLPKLRTSELDNTIASAWTRLSDALHESDYDYVLIDRPVSNEATAHLEAGLMRGALIVCFRILPDFLGDAKELASAVTLGSRGPVYAVPTRLVTGDELQVERDLARVGAAFRDLLGTHGNNPGDAAVGIPYADYASQSPLAILMEEPGTSEGPLAAYERLVSVLTHGRVTRSTRRLTPDPLYVNSFRQSMGATPGAEHGPRFVVAYTARDRAWADWIRAELAVAGSEVTMVGPGAADKAPNSATVLRLTSPDPGGALSETMPEQVFAHSDAVTVRLAGYPGYRDYGVRASGRTINLSDLTEDEARQRLLADLVLPRNARPRRLPRFPVPGSKPLVRIDLPSRNPLFGGRAPELEALRQAFLDGHSIRSIKGPRGLGKSEIAREYAYRFEHDYDIICWLDASSPKTVRSGLTKLRPHLPRFGRREEADLVGWLLSQLAAAAKPWLLIYDNADEADVLEGLLPSAASLGHIIITSRLADDVEPELEPFSEGDCRSVMIRQVDLISPAQFSSIAAAVNHLPVAVRLVARLIHEDAAHRADMGSGAFDAVTGSVESALRRLSDSLAPADAEPSDVAVAVLALTEADLEREPLGELVMSVSNLCAFLTPGRIPFSLLTSHAFLDQLIEAAGPTMGKVLADAGALHRVLNIGQRYGLFEIDRQQKCLRMHRVLQDALIERMGSQTAAQRQSQILHALARFAPSEAEGDFAVQPQNMSELDLHIEYAGAEFSNDYDVRRMLLQYLRWTYRNGDAPAWKHAVEWAERLMARWQDQFGREDHLTLRFMAQLANVHRALGDNETALKYDEESVVTQRRLYGSGNPRTLVAARGRGGDLRGLSNPEEALYEDQSTLQNFTEVLGAEHQDSLMTAANLGQSSFLVGDLTFALSVVTDALRTSERVLGLRDILTVRLGVTEAMIRRELGDYKKSIDSLRQAEDRLAVIDHAPEIETLKIQRQKIVTERRWHRSAKMNRSLISKFEAVLGADHPATWSCELCLAFDDHVSKRNTDAIAAGTKCLNLYQQRFGHHAFVHACEVNLGVFLRGGRRFEASVEMGEKGLYGLLDMLPKQHPWVLVAMADQAVNLAASGRTDSAVELAQDVAGRFTEVFRFDHPRSRLMRQMVNWMTDHKSTPEALAGEYRWPSFDIDIPDT